MKMMKAQQMQPDSKKV